MNSKIKTALLLAFITHIINAQDYNMQRVSNKSNVEVNSAVSNGISVDMFKGTLNCNIPLYEIKGREMNFPISLNYTANGIKVNQVASNVGLGWNLNAGGGITRIINAAPDNRSVIYSNPNFPCQNLFSEASSQIHLIGLNYLTTKDFYKVSSLGLEEVLQSQRSVIFLEPLLNENRIVQGDPNTDIKIVDENGTTYYFNYIDSEKNISSTYQSGCQIDQQIYTSYYHLSKIESKNKLDTYTIEYQTFKWTTLIPNNGEGQKIDSYTTIYKMISSSYKLIQKMPKAIYHNSTKMVEFTYGNRNDLSFEEFQGNSLVSINILKYNSTDIRKKIQFNYSYFGASVPSSIVFNRLKLDEIKAIGYDEEQNELAETLYEFNYEQPEMVRPINSYAQDYLGLYNGKNNNTNLILNCDYNPNYINSNYDFNPPNSNRSFSFSHSIIGTLNKIINPNKGYTVFEYEQNELVTPGATIENPSVVRLLDGFRIKSISNYNFDDTFVSKKKYIYLKSKLNETIINGFILSPITATAGYSNPVLETHTLSKGYQNPNDLVHYKNVLEMNVDSQDNHNGFIQYIFGKEPYGNETEITPFYLKGEINSFVYIQGGYNYKKFDLLTTKKIYNKNLELLREENYTYERILDYEGYNTLGLSSYPNYEIENLNINDPATRSETILTNTQYSDNNGVYDSKYYFYDEFFHLAEQNKPSENENISYTYTNFPYLSSIISSIKGVIKYIYSNTQFPHLVTEIQQANPDKPLNTVVKFTYDEFGNKVETIQYTPGNLTNASYESYIYGYNNSLPVAKLIGVKYADIMAIHNRINQIKAATDVEISEASEENLRAELNELRRDFPQALVTTYTYDPVIGITSVTDSKNYTIYTVYDALGRIKFTKEKDLNGNFNILTEGQYNTLSN
jgi:hypothetical protein